MNRLPALTGKEVLRVLGKVGFVVVRVKGSHHFLRHNDGLQNVVPVHAGDTIGPGLLSKILRDCEISKAEFETVAAAKK